MDSLEEEIRNMVSDGVIDKEKKSAFTPGKHNIRANRAKAGDGAGGHGRGDDRPRMFGDDMFDGREQTSSAERRG
jgi:ribosomal protein L19E